MLRVIGKRIALLVPTLLGLSILLFVWVRNLPSGKPVLEYSDSLKQLLSQRGVCGSHLSLTDERGVAMATVILECAS